ncbi:MAG: MoxR family ATPase [Pseudobacteriovorax sp.]|nr:MoxR family ATPase [Pseudobacteriovorax sp.]
MAGRVLVGQDHVLKRLIMGLLCDGHVLLEGLPGLAKTTAVKALSDTAHLSVSRIQFTPDLLPADVIGTQLYNPKEGNFTVKQGPIFCHLLIADEINRAPAKVQSALLEAMQEKQVTLGDHSYKLEAPFLVMATQNPIEQEGTYPLPEAQMDRFLFKVLVGYSSPEDEIKIMQRMATGETISLEQTLSSEDIFAMKSLVNQVYIAPDIRKYIVDLVFATRRIPGNTLSPLQKMIHVGASPRASINLEKASRANAFIEGRDYVSPQDVKDVCHDVMRHRIIPTFEAEADGVTSDDIVKELLLKVAVP